MQSMSHTEIDMDEKADMGTNKGTCNFVVSVTLA